MRPWYPAELALVVLAYLHLQAESVSGQTLQGNDCTGAGAYTLCQNLWGAYSGVGSQSTSLYSANGNAVSWETKYTWSNSPNNVKSYPNVYHNTAKGMQLQDVVSASSSWQWNYQSASNDLRADVSYDIWFGVAKSGDVASAASSYEIVSGIGGVVAPNLQLGGHTWNLRHGPNGNWDVFSFITAEGDITDFDADLNDFFQYLVNQQGVAKTQYIQAIQAGTEPFTGTADLVSTHFSVNVSTEQDTTPLPPSSSSPPPQTSTTPTSTKTSPPSTKSTTSYHPTSSQASDDGSTSGTSSDIPEQTSDPAASDGGSVRNAQAGAAQCRLQLPSQRKLRRRSWIGTVFQ
ncbi:concanavalin A-like lectin/glucanase domain-containing protein [Fomes fomentarius]|nr:concanavalin A-like lectin/glucanase domain-containing protein [Fomes fomentarius]